MNNVNPYGYIRRDVGELENVHRVRDFGGAPARETTPSFTPMPLEESAHDKRTRAQSYASLLCGGRLPITGIGNTFQGADLDGPAVQYKQIYKNTNNRVIAVKVAVEFGPSTGSIDFAFSTDLSGQDLIDSVSASGRVVTEDILLRPDQILYAATRDPLVLLNGAALRVLLLDPVAVFGEAILP